MEFDKLLYVFPSNLEYLLSNIPNELKKSVYEIRLRCDKPLMLRASCGVLFLMRNGQVSSAANDDCVRIGIIEMEVIFSRLCEQSLYSHENTIKNGYIPLKNGCRAGICGDFSDSTFNLRSVASLNLRIARQVKNSDEQIYKLIGHTSKSVLIAGAPGSGKTTVLRELSRRYSQKLYTVCILDERGELAGMYDSKPAFDVGICTDVISFRDKRSAADIAVKYMCPQIISFDELSDDGDILKRCAVTGVKLFTTMHADSINAVLERLQILGISRKYFDIIAVLDNSCSGNVSEFLKYGAM